MIAWVIERACLKTGRSITDVGDGGAAGKCAAYLASLGRAERRRSSASARLPDHEREMIAQKALDLLSSHFSAISNMTAETVLSIRSVDHNSSVVTLSMNTCGRPSTRSNNSRRGREQKRKRLALASRNRSITWSRRLAASAAPAGTATTRAAACAATTRARGSATCSRRARPAPSCSPDRGRRTSTSRATSNGARIGGATGPIGDPARSLCSRAWAGWGCRPGLCERRRRKCQRASD